LLIATDGTIVPKPLVPARMTVVREVSGTATAKTWIYGTSAIDPAPWWACSVKIRESCGAKTNIAAAATVPMGTMGHTATLRIRRTSCVLPSARYRGIIRISPVSAPSSIVLLTIV